MTLNMLRAVSKMLDGVKETKVECAKIMLDEIILSMTPPPLTFPPKVVLDDLNQIVEDEPVYDIKVNPQTKALEYIKCNGEMLDDEMMVTLDNKSMPYKDAVGKNFQVIKVD